MSLFQYYYTIATMGFFPLNKVSFNHVPNRSFGSVPIMAFGSLPVVAVGSFNVVSSTRTVPVIQVGDCPFEPFPAFPPTLFANSTN
jgi:hypothetical protein